MVTSVSQASSSSQYSVSENSAYVTSLGSASLTTGTSYTIVGGADAGLFSLDASSGALQFVTAPDYEAAADADKDNYYDLLVRTTDANGLSSDTLLRIEVLDQPTLQLVFSGGQSLSVGQTADESTLSSVALYPDNVLTLDFDGIDANVGWGGKAVNEAAFNGFTPLTETDTETHVSGMMNMLTYQYEAHGLTAPTFVHINTGFGGRSILQLMTSADDIYTSYSAALSSTASGDIFAVNLGNNTYDFYVRTDSGALFYENKSGPLTYFDNLVDQMALATEYGREQGYEVSTSILLNWIQGQNDTFMDTTAAGLGGYGYTYALGLLIDKVEAAAQEIVDSSASLTGVISQIRGYDNKSISVDQLDYIQSNPNFALGATEYQFEALYPSEIANDYTHLSPEGYYMMGQTIGAKLFDLVNGEENKPITIESIEQTSKTTVLVHFSGVETYLVNDASIYDSDNAITAPSNMGFGVFSTTGTGSVGGLKITGATIVGADTVLLTFNKALTSDVRIYLGRTTDALGTYATNALWGFGGTTLRDAATTDALASTDGVALKDDSIYEYAPVQYVTITPNQNASTTPAANAAPVVSSARATLAASATDASYTVTLAQLLTGLSDANGDTLSVLNVSVNHGTVSANAGGTFTITPTSGYTGTMTISYDVMDGRGGLLATSLTYGVGTSTPPVNDNAITGTAGNDTLYGDGKDNVIYGLAGDDILYGATGNDHLYGGDGNDQLWGQPGADTMEGGMGDDMYVVDDPGDVVIEEANAGTDTVYAVIDYALGANVERLTLTGTANLSATGNELANVIKGNSGDNVIAGGLGADVLYGNGGADTFLFDTLETNAQADTIKDMVAGTDKIAFDAAIFTALGSYAGGALPSGTLHYGATAASANDHLLYDTATGSLYYDADGAGGAAAIKIATLTGKPMIVDSDIVIIGDAPATPTGGSTITGTAGNDTLTGDGNANTIYGLAGDDILYGGMGNDHLIGGDGNDQLWGQPGADLMEGGTGDDMYVVDDPGDVVIEEANAGTDTVYAVIDYTLGANVERLTLTGTTNLSATGNELANVLKGNSADNVIAGGLGADILYGNGGADTFLFDTLESSAQADTIKDMVSGTDKIAFDDAVFTALGGYAGGTLPSGTLHYGATAAAANDHLLYDTSTGILYYDADGVGGTAAIKIATLTGKPMLLDSDILVM